MRKLKLQVQITVDGFIAGPDGRLDWMKWSWDEDLKRYVNGVTEAVDCILLGRVLAEKFIPSWQARISESGVDEAFARKMVETPKVVFSKTLKHSPWEHTSIANGNLADKVNNLKNQPGKDLIAYGGARFVSSLIEHGLVDEYHLFVNPVAIGVGLPIFGQLKESRAFKLVNATSFQCGIALLCYKPDDSETVAHLMKDN